MMTPSGSSQQSSLQLCVTLSTEINLQSHNLESVNRKGFFYLPYSKANEIHLDFLKVVRLVFWSGGLVWWSGLLGVWCFRSLALRARTIALRTHSRATRSKARLVSKSRNTLRALFLRLQLET